MLSCDNEKTVTLYEFNEQYEMTELSQVTDVSDPSLATLETFDAKLSIIQIAQSYM